MEILILLGAIIAGSFWVKNQYPESRIAKGIDSLLAQGLSLVNKTTQPNANPNSVVQQNPQIVAGQQATPSATINVQVSAEAIEKLGVSVNPLSEVPEDSVLRRHYFATLEAERESITNPYPTDSVLRRHYESRFETLSSPSLPFAVPASLATASAAYTKLKAPEDQVLRRHFLTQLRAEIEANFLPRPTDSTLARHYESLIQAEVASRLQAAI